MTLILSSLYLITVTICFPNGECNSKQELQLPKAFCHLIGAGKVDNAGQWQDMKFHTSCTPVSD